MAEKEYISRTEFLEQKRKQYCEDCERRKGMKNGKYKMLYEIGGAPCRACGVSDMLDDVEDFPAADVEPVRHGRWITDSDGLPICSECEEVALQRVFIKLPEKIVDLQMVKSKRCPNCGAKMDWRNNNG